MMTTVLQFEDSIAAVLWPLMRVSGVIMVAPILSSAFVPVRVRVLIAVVITIAVLPFVREVPDLGLPDGAVVIAIARELALGLSMGFILRLVIDAAVVGGQIIATSMGLHFATVIDPHQGGTPTVGQLYVLVSSLLLLATDTHLVLVELLAHSFELLPITSAAFTVDTAWNVVQFAGRMFAGGLQLALPSVTGILMVNATFGVVSRAAPSLNLFAVGFPVSMLTGFVIMLLTSA